jgi:hypothetical protein
MREGRVFVSFFNINLDKWLRYHMVIRRKAQVEGVFMLRNG